MPKRTIEIRTRISVEIGSPEEILWEYLKNKKVTPYPFHQMLTMAVTPFWLALAYQHNKYSENLVAQALEDGTYGWQLHDKYLHQKTRILRAQAADDQKPNAPSQFLTQPMRIIDRTDSDSTLTAVSVKNGGVENKATVSHAGTSEPFNVFGQSIISKQSKQLTQPN